MSFFSDRFARARPAQGRQNKPMQIPLSRDGEERQPKGERENTHKINRNLVAPFGKKKASLGFKQVGGKQNQKKKKVVGGEGPVPRKTFLQDSNNGFSSQGLKWVQFPDSKGQHRKEGRRRFALIGKKEVSLLEIRVAGGGVKKGGVASPQANQGWEWTMGCPQSLPRFAEGGELAVQRKRRSRCGGKKEQNSQTGRMRRGGEKRACLKAREWLQARRQSGERGGGGLP